LAQNDETLTLLLLTYPDRATAEAAAGRIAEGWNEELPSGPSMRDTTGTTAETRVTGNGPFVTVVAMQAPLAVDTGWPSNPAYRALSDRSYGVSFSLFGPE
jgi:hypothetical protein